MVDIAKKVNKKPELLEAGESCAAATCILKAGQFNRSVAIGAIGGLAGAAVAAALNRGEEDAQEGTMADTFPRLHQAILALTDRGWIVFEQSAMSGGPKAVHTRLEHGDITGLELEKGKLMNRLTLTFRDGSDITMEAPKANKPQKLVDAAART
ncbi:MAG: hypothetical protein AAGA90_02700 [Actinomycetota bacterium]